MHGTVFTLLLLGVASVSAEAGTARPVLRSVEHPAHLSPLHSATYLKPTGVEMFKPTDANIMDPPGNKTAPNGFFSPDNGRTWQRLPANPDFDSKLPHGYRRDPFPVYVDPVNGNILRLVPSLDTPGLDPSAVEPPVSMEAYYLRYRVSIDGGKTFLFDEPVVQKGKTPENPFDGVYKGKNGIFMGDVGSQMIRTREGRILIPAQACKLGPDGKLWSPGGGFTYTDVIMILGRWTKDHRVEWEISRPIEADPVRSTRGMIEPTVAELPNGRLLCVMRGSNGGTKDPQFRLPSRRWWSLSTDGGFHWIKPEPWTYDDGTEFFSPSSMSQLLKHSSGKIFWIGNISPENCSGNNPRYPLVIGQVDCQSLKLLRNSILTIDTKRPDEPGVNLSHWWGFEDRANKDIVIVGARHSPDYTKAAPVVYRIGIEQQH
jgi:hypothetical protein